MSRAERVTEVTPDVGAGATAAHLRGLVSHVRPVTLAGERTFPVSPDLESLVPLGLRRGSTVVVTGTGGAQGVESLAFALAVAAATAGSWCGAVGIPDLGLVAVAELGFALDRLALVPRVAPDQWVTVVGALLDAVDVLIVRPPAHLRLGDARRLTTRTRERGAVLIPIGNQWADGADVRLVVTGSRWEGPGAGEGHLLRRHLNVTAGGRGAAARSRHVDLWLPGGPQEENMTSRYAGSDADLIPDPDTKTLRSAG